MKRITFLEAAEPPHLDFVLPGMLAGTVGMIVGQGAVGKSFLALHIGISVALGKPACTGTGGDALWPAPASGPVAIVMGEDIPEVVRYRLHELRASLSPDDLSQIDEELDVQSWTDEQDDLRVIQRQPGGLIGHGPFYSKLRALAEGRRLVILDPLAFLHDCDENNNGDMTTLMRALGGIARATGCAILVLHHIGKSKDGDDWERSRGASSLTTAVRLQLNLTVMSASEAEEYGIADDLERHFYIRLAWVKANYGKPVQPKWLRKQSGGRLMAYALQRLGKGNHRSGSGKERRNGAI